METTMTTALNMFTSTAYELAILVTFFASFMAWNSWLMRNKKKPAKGHSSDDHDVKGRGAPARKARPLVKDADRLLMAQKDAAQIMALAQEQYTRALRLYRELSRRGDDHYIREEAFYFGLVQASIRVGNADVVVEVLRAAKRHKVELSVQFFQSVLKLLASKQLYNECLVVQELFREALPAERTICSCISLASAECGVPTAGIEAIERLRVAGEETSGRDYLNLFRHYSKAHNWQDAVKLLYKLQKDAVPFEAIITNVALAACVVSQQVDVAADIIARAEGDKALPIDVVSYNTVLKGYAREKKLKECFKLVDLMAQRNVQLDEVTHSTLLDACISDSDFECATMVIDKFIQSGCGMNTVLYTTFMKGFVRMGMLDKAMDLYNQMRNIAAASDSSASNAGDSNAEPGVAKAKPDIILYSVLIKANCDQRRMEPALRLAQDMLNDGLEADDMIVNRLLDGCRHLGHDELGDKIFDDFVGSGQVRPTPPTIATMVKIYGKAGRIDDAALLVDSMNSKWQLKPSVVIYTCLMSACARNNRLDLALCAFDKMIANGVEPDEMTYSTLLKACGQGKDWDSALQITHVAAKRACKTRFPGEALNSVLTQMIMQQAHEPAAALRAMLRERQIPSSPARCGENYGQGYPARPGPAGRFVDRGARRPREQ